jgi:hypothetical protein
MTFCTPYGRSGGNTSSSVVPSNAAGVAISRNEGSTAFPELRRCEITVAPVPPQHRHVDRRRPGSEDRSRRLLGRRTGPRPDRTRPLRRCSLRPPSWVACPSSQPPVAPGRPASPVPAAPGSRAGAAVSIGVAGDAGAGGAGAGVAGDWEPPPDSAGAVADGDRGGVYEPETAAPEPPPPPVMPATRSNRSRRETRASGAASVSGIVARISASSRERRGEVVQRMSVCAAIRSAITRPSSAAEYFAACAVRRSPHRRWRRAGRAGPARS